MKTQSDSLKDLLANQEVFELDPSDFLCTTPEEIKADIVDYIIWEIYRKYCISKEEEALYKWNEFKDYLSGVLKEKYNNEC